MKFYRRLGKIEAISFDLDDTLYTNRPVMMATEQAMIAYFDELLSPLDDEERVYNYKFWWPFRQQAISLDAKIAHDVTELRRLAYRLGINSIIKNEAIAREMADKALAYFIKARSNFKVPQLAHDLLGQLAKKYPLVAISNGNVDTNAIEISDYFELILMASTENPKKPHVNMFQRASKALNIPLAHFLHVGDCGHADVFGALRAGMQSAWLSSYDVGKPVRTIPHVEITNIDQLSRLI